MVERGYVWCTFTKILYTIKNPDLIDERVAFAEDRRMCMFEDMPMLKLPDKSFSISIKLYWLC